MFLVFRLTGDTNLNVDSLTFAFSQFFNNRTSHITISILPNSILYYFTFKLLMTKKDIILLSRRAVATFEVQANVTLALPANTQASVINHYNNATSVSSSLRAAAADPVSPLGSSLSGYTIASVSATTGK